MAFDGMRILETRDMVLETLKIAAQRTLSRFPGVQKYDVRANEAYDLDALIATLEAQLLGEHVETETIRFETTVPSTWWQHFKQTYKDSWWLKWYVDRHPVLIDRRCFSQDVKHYEAYPNCTRKVLKPAWLGQPIRIALLQAVNYEEMKDVD